MEFHCLTLGMGWRVGPDVDNQRIVSKFIRLSICLPRLRKISYPLSMLLFFDTRVTFTDGGYRKMNPHAPNKTTVETDVLIIGGGLAGCNAAIGRRIRARAWLSWTREG